MRALRPFHWHRANFRIVAVSTRRCSIAPTGFSPDLVVLAGYMRIIDATVVAQWRGRMINIHPSLLPKYPGLDTHRRALECGDRTYGSSVHFVTAQLDGGPVIAQVTLPVMADDTRDSLAGVCSRWNIDC